MPGHTHLYRRGAVYYFRCAVPNEIKDTYGKREELRSLRTRDHKEAVRKLAAVTHEVMQAFEAHRRKLEQLAGPPLSDLSPEQLATIRAAYLSFRLEEDEETREEGFEEFEDTPQGRLMLTPTREDPRPTFEEAEQLLEDMDEVNRFCLARRKLDPFFAEEAKEVLSWDGIGLRLAPDSRAGRRQPGPCRKRPLRLPT